MLNSTRPRGVNTRLTFSLLAFLAMSFSEVLVSDALAQPPGGFTEPQTSRTGRVRIVALPTDHILVHVFEIVQAKLVLDETSDDVTFEHVTRLFTAKAGWKLQSLLKAAGNNVEPGVSYEVDDAYASEHLVGKIVGGDVEIEEYQDKPRNTVKRFDAPVEKPF